MIPSDPVSMQRATSEDAPLIANLLELYVHDMSEVFPCEVGADGRFGYPKLSTYWSEPDTRSIYVIRRGDAIAGFAFVTVGSPASDEPAVHDVAEFFVLRRHRRAGVGRKAAMLLWDLLPGAWTVRVHDGNHRGLAFWPAVVHAYAQGEHTESRVPGTPDSWRVFHLHTRVRRSIAPSPSSS
jgi:predicted acetyltransferase